MDTGKEQGSATSEERAPVECESSVHFGAVDELAKNDSCGARKVASDLGAANLSSVRKLQVRLQRPDGPDHNQAMKSPVEFDENGVVSLSMAMYST
jgi:hypothetical protein